MILFLDFDGVLHPVGKHRDYDFSRLPLLETWLRENAHVDVVISSSWRDTLSIEQLREFFSSDLQSRIISKCPSVLSDPEPEFWRHAEIMAWIDVTGYAGQWLALDDTSYEFPNELLQLVLCDRDVGIDDSVISELTRKMRDCKSENPLLSFSRGLITKDQAIAESGLRDYAELLVAMGDADVPLPTLSQEQIDQQVKEFTKLLKVKNVN